MTFGAFDLCHQGHINLLRQAKERCNKLIVCISSDDYIIEAKGNTPILCYKDRVYLVGLTGLADKIVKQTVKGKQPLVKKYKPDVLFVGDDWNKNTFGGEGLCRVEYLKRTEGISTSWYKTRLYYN